MIFLGIIFIFIIFMGLAGSVLRKKIYKKLLSLSLSLNTLIVSMGLIAHVNNNQDFRVFCVLAVFVSCLVIGGAFYICYELNKLESR